MLFAVPRAAGYLAHWRESLTDPDVKIMRPQQIYRGVWLRRTEHRRARAVQRRGPHVERRALQRVAAAAGGRNRRDGGVEVPRVRRRRVRQPGESPR